MDLKKDLTLKLCLVGQCAHHGISSSQVQTNQGAGTTEVGFWAIAVFLTLWSNYWKNY